MNALEATSLAIALIAALAAWIVPTVIYRRTKRGEDLQKNATAEAMEDRTAASTWRDINKALSDDRENLQRQLNDQKRDHDETVRDLRKEYEKKLADQDTRINSMQREIDRLYRELYSRDHPGTP